MRQVSRSQQQQVSLRAEGSALIAPAARVNPRNRPPTAHRHPSPSPALPSLPPVPPAHPFAFDAPEKRLLRRVRRTLSLCVRPYFCRVRMRTYTRGIRLHPHERTRTRSVRSSEITLYFARRRDCRTVRDRVVSFTERGSSQGESDAIAAARGRYSDAGVRVNEALHFVSSRLSWSRLPLGRSTSIERTGLVTVNFSLRRAEMTNACMVYRVDKSRGASSNLIFPFFAEIFVTIFREVSTWSRNLFSRLPPFTRRIRRHTYERVGPSSVKLRQFAVIDSRSGENKG